MKSDSKIARLVFASPWLLLIFCVVPLLVLMAVFLHLNLPLANSKYPLLYNNACFTLFVALRLLYYLQGIARGVRYGSGSGAPRESLAVAGSTEAVRASLAGAGFVFSRGGEYAEKRDAGYLGTAIFYAGLLLVLFTGTRDNMCQYSGVLLDGVGVSTDLNRVEAYRRLTTGPLTRKPTTLPRMKIIRQIIPGDAYPRGAVGIAFISAEGKEQEVVLKASELYPAGDYDLYMSKMVYEPQLAIAINDSSPVFSGKVLLHQMAAKENGFGFYGAFVEGPLDGEVYYQPEKSRLKVVVHQGRATLLDTELIFQIDRLSRSANFSVLCEKMGVWSEIHVVHRRHLSLIFLGAVIAMVGLLARAAIRPQRVWLEDAPEGCRARVVGREATKLLGEGDPSAS